MSGSLKSIMNKKLITIIDYNMGNAKSVKNSLKKIDINAKIVSQPTDLEESCGIILPGVGSFNKAIKNLYTNKLFQKINTLVKEEHIPYLGICLGMQLIAEDSTENQLTKGFGWIRGKVRKIDSNNQIRLPHVGWNQIVKNGNSKLLSRIENNTNYYFDHSFALSCDTQNIISSTVNYGNKNLIASIEFDNIFGTQFHPEKSQINGLRVLKAFTKFVYSNQ